MKMKYTYSLTFVGGALGWETVKAVIIPMIFLTTAVAGSTEYVHWVIKSHNSSVLQLKAGADGVFIGDMRINRFVDDLKEMVEARNDFIKTYQPDDHSDVYLSAKIESMRLEDAKVLAQADQLRNGSADAYTKDIASKTDQLKALDDQLKVFGEEAAGRSRS